MCVLWGVSHDAAEKISALTNDGTQLNTKARDVANLAMPSMQQMNILISEIARASSQQSVSSEQINNTLMELGEFLRNNAANSESLAANAEELDAQAKRLKQTIAFFIESNAGIIFQQKLRKHDLVALTDIPQPVDQQRCFTEK